MIRYTRQPYNSTLPLYAFSDDNNTRIKYLAEITMGHSPSSSDVNEEGYGLPFIQGSAEFGDEHPSNRSFCNGPCRVCSTGDVLISVRAPVGEINIAPSCMAIGRGVAAITATAMPSRYLWYALHARKENLFAVQKGTTFQSITRIDLANLSIPRYCEKIETIIANFLDRETSRIDSLIAEKEKMIGLLQEKKSALITQAVTKGLDPNVEMKDSGVEWIGKVPKEWTIVPLKHLVDCLDNKRIPLNAEQRALMKGNIPYWGAGGVVDHINEFIFDEELVLLGEDGAPFFDKMKPVAHFVSGKTWVNNHIHVLRAKPHVPSEWLVHCLNSVDYRHYITGSTRDKLTQEQMSQIALPLPSDVSEASVICSHVSRACQLIESTLEEIQRSVDLLKEKRQSLITAAVTGQLDISEMEAAA